MGFPKPTTGGGSTLPIDPVTLATAATILLGTRVTGDAVDRWNVAADGKMSWGAGAGAMDEFLSRRNNSMLQVNLDFMVQQGNGPQMVIGNASSSRPGLLFGTAQDTDLFRIGTTQLATSSELRFQTPGKGLAIKEGANAKMGVATLVGGTVTVATTAVTAASRIFLSDQGGGVLANIGSLSVANLVAATSFDIKSSNALDSSNVAWLIFEPS